MSTLIFLIAFIGAYGIGSICSAVIVSKLCHLPDPRTQGSHNPGATNVLRLSGKKYAIIVLLADALKGLLPVALLSFLHLIPHDLGYIGLAAILGHMYPVFFQFNGGKGVATTLGVLLGLNGLLGLAVIATWLLVAVITRYSSLAALVAILLSPLYAMGYGFGHLVWPLCLIAIGVVYQHRENIQRLMAGKESKIKI